MNIFVAFFVVKLKVRGGPPAAARAGFLFFPGALAQGLGAFFGYLKLPSFFSRLSQLINPFIVPEVLGSLSLMCSDARKSAETTWSTASVLKQITIEYDAFSTRRVANNTIDQPCCSARWCRSRFRLAMRRQAQKNSYWYSGRPKHYVEKKRLRSARSIRKLGSTVRPTLNPIQ